MELADSENRDEVTTELENFLDSIELVTEYYFARHGEKIVNLDEGYEGEYDQYKRLWPYQKKLWEWITKFNGPSLIVCAFTPFHRCFLILRLLAGKHPRKIG